ncbi:MAG TPA: enoyl-CoA hydratase, partial [Haliea salexigens]|nr:enoyl-CoA hydratase [Haliea salexigens]
MNYRDNYKALKISQENRILTITLDRPEAKNAVNPAVHEELSRIFSDVDRDTGTDVVILTGANNAFCAGGDLEWLMDINGDPVA